MTVSSIGDLALSFQLRRDTERLKSDFVEVSREISTGIKSDLVEAFRGDFSTLSSLQYDMARMEGYQSVIETYKLDLSTQQTVLQKMRDSGSVYNTFLGLSGLVTSSALDSFGLEAERAFETSLQALNTNVAGKTIFAGVATDMPAVADAETMLAALAGAISTAGATTVADVESVVFTWFGPGGGYDTIGYLGGAQSSTSLSLSDTEIGQPLVTAEDGAIRDYLSSLALGAISTRNIFPGDPEQQSELLRRSGERVLAANETLVELQSVIGNSEGTVQRASVEVTNQREAFEIARAELLEVDAFEAATELQNAEAQLQTIYALTGRLSRLSLVDYL